MLSVNSHRVAHNFLQGCDYDCFKMSLQKLVVVHSLMYIFSLTINFLIKLQGLNKDILFCFPAEVAFNLSPSTR